MDGIRKELTGGAAAPHRFRRAELRDDPTASRHEDAFRSYPSEAMISRYAGSGNAFMVVVRT